MTGSSGSGGSGIPRARSLFSGFSPPLQVVGFISTRPGDPERGPLVRMRPDDALIRLVTHGELVRVVSERRQEIAVLETDESLARGSVVLRDVVGASISEIIRVIKLDTDAPRRV